MSVGGLSAQPKEPFAQGKKYIQAGRKNQLPGVYSLRLTAFDDEQPCFSLLGFDRQFRP